MKDKTTIKGLLLAAEWCDAYEGDPPTLWRGMPTADAVATAEQRAETPV